MNNTTKSIEYAKAIAGDLGLELVSANFLRRSIYNKPWIIDFVVCIKVNGKEHYGASVFDESMLDIEGLQLALVKESLNEAIDAAMHDWNPRLSDLEAFKRETNEQTNRVFERVKGVT